MADTKISAAADIVSVVSTDMLPVARSGSTTAYHATMAEMATWATTNLPTASTTVLGGVKIDGTSVTIASGVISAVTALSSSNPLMDGTTNPGTGPTASRYDHVHPSDTTRAPLASPTFTGTVTIPSGAAIAGYAPLASPTFTGTPSMPTGTTAVTQAVGTSNTALATTAFTQAVAAPAFNDVGRNLVHNPVFTVQQRGTGAWTASGGYTADRWLMGAVNDTVSISIQTLADADRTAIGDEAAQFALQSVFTGSATAGSVSNLQQRIESVRRLSGKTVTISLWARATSGTPRLGIAMSQSFGSGGSPSTAVVIPIGATAVLSTTWARSTFTVALPSAAGKVFGTTAGTDYSGLILVTSDQGNAWGTGIGVQSGTIQIFGVQLELGTIATPLAKRDPADELSLCQRFYYVRQLDYAAMGYNVAAAAVYGMHTLPVTMRALPTLTFSSQSYNNCSALTQLVTTSDSISVQATVTATGTAYVNAIITASADL